MSQNIQHASKLLQGIVDGLRAVDAQVRPRTGLTGNFKLGSLEVVFVVHGSEEFEFGLVQALDALANDTYWDERGNWSEATEARVRVK